MANLIHGLKILGCATAVGVLIAAGSSPARADAMADCNQRENRDLRIRGCTALIQSGKLSPENVALAHNLRGAAYQDKGDLERAFTDYDEALRRDPTLEAALAGKILVREEAMIACEQTTDRARQLTGCSATLRFFGKDAPIPRATAYLARGLLYRDRGMRQEAIADLKKAIETEPAPTSPRGRELVNRAQGALDALTKK